MEPPPRKKALIIIVGGGITGLTLALMFERLQISYVLLEAHASLHAEVGTTIALFPNGLRILDQIGVYEDINAVAQLAMRQRVIDGETGKQLYENMISDIMQHRHGFGILFLARHELLYILERRIKDKDCVFTNKRVTKVENFEDFVEVHCQDGIKYEGQVVIGADGVHSTVRREMWRVADEMDPGCIPEKERSSIRCEYACLFGISHPTGDFVPGDILSIQRANSNAGVMCGRNRELFLFYYWKLPEPHTITPNNIPLFTKEDEKRRWVDAADLGVACSGLKFGDLVANLERSGATSLPHHVYKTWYFKRIIIIGDAAHKFNPLFGQGGNNCIESAAALVNHLSSSLSEISISYQGLNWPTFAVAKAFATTQEQRVPRVIDLVEKCQKVQYSAAWDTWGYEILAKYLMPYLSRAKYADFYSNFIVGGLKLYGDLWGLEKEHSMPWDDEKQQSKQERDNISTRLLAAASVTIVAGILAANAFRSKVSQV